MTIQRVCVFCASSDRCQPLYLDAARKLGQALASARLTVVYGGGSTGLMGQLADGALSAPGGVEPVSSRVIGVLPQFMDEVEWGHRGVDLKIVDDMHERTKRMCEWSDAFVTLPGGCGTFDELFQSLTWKRLGLHAGPIIIVNVDGYFDQCIAQLQRCIAEGFMNEVHENMWTVVDTPDAVLDALHAAPAWSEDAISFARPGAEDRER